MAFEKAEKDLLSDDRIKKDAKRYIGVHYQSKDLPFDSFLLFIHIPAFPKATVKKIFAERRNAACKRCRRRFFK